MHWFEADDDADVWWKMDFEIRKVVRQVGSGILR